MQEVKIKLLHPEAKIPSFGTEKAAAGDMYATEIIKESPSSYLIKFGFAIEFSDDYRFMIVPRSSMTKTEFVLQNSPGIGDADYRGEYSIRLRAIPKIDYVDRLDERGNYMKVPVLTYPEFPFKAGDRVAQCYFDKITRFNWVVTGELSSTARGEGGYGSTGK